MNFHTKAGFGLCVLAGFTLAIPAHADLLTNGNFGTGDFTGWSYQVEDGSSGAFIVAANSVTTLPNGEPSVGGPVDGDNYAVTEQESPGAYSLSQAFTVGANATDVTVSFMLFANDFGPGVDSGPLDYTGAPVEFGTADLLTGSANGFSTAAGDVIQNFYQGADDQGTPNPWTPYSFDITNEVVPGGTYQIRFGEADNEGFFSLGVADVSVSESDAPSAPEPATFLLLIPALAGMAAFRRKLVR